MLLDIFGGKTVRFPSRADLQAALRDLRVYHDVLAGRPVEEVARRHGVPESVVAGIVRAIDEDEEEDRVCPVCGRWFQVTPNEVRLTCGAACRERYYAGLDDAR